ncbi:MAG: endonuclease [Magnetococcales bacterium]|nr:endonuclease [Magnetococcales bacterium]
MTTIRPDRLFEQLHAAYGPQYWWPAKSPFAMMVGAILVQNTAWAGAARAVDRLEDAGFLHPAAIRPLEEETLWELIRPAGYFRVKAKRLRALCTFLQGFDDDLDRLFALETPRLREALLGVNGVGEETADSILCYGAKRAIFVADAYTRRLFHRLHWVEEKAGYGEMQSLVQTRMPGNQAQLGEFHALIVRHGKHHCRAKPVCRECPVSGCPAMRAPPQGLPEASAQ